MASVAGKILQEYEKSSPENSVCEKEHPSLEINSNCKKEEQLLNLDLFKQGISDIETCLPGVQEEFPILSNEPPSYIHDRHSTKMSPKFDRFDLTEKAFLSERFVGDNGNSSPGSSSSKTKAEYSHRREHLEEKLQNVVERELETEISNVDDGVVSLGIWEDSKEQDFKTTVLDCQETDKESLAKNFLTLAPFSDDCNTTKVSHRDNDENSSWQIQPSEKVKDYCPPPHTGCQRMRTVSASRHWRVSSSKGMKSVEVILPAHMS